MEELNEEDILWPHDHEGSKEEDIEEQESTPAVVTPNQQRETAPISIPSRGNLNFISQSWTAGIDYINRTGNGSQDHDYGDDGDGDDYDGDDHVGNPSASNGVITPPHIFLQRRNDRKATRSVCEGYGRTLKGWDLRNTRDKILRLTGFLEK